MADESLHDRLLAAAGDRTFRHLAEITNTNAETVRRYMRGQAPSVEFVAAICEALAINGAWLLTGVGPMRAGDVRGAALGEARAAELLNAVADRLTDLIDRVERLEVFVQTLETRVRASAYPDGDAAAATRGEDAAPGDGPLDHHRTSADKPGAAAVRDGDRGLGRSGRVQVSGAAGRVARAAAQRSRPVAD